MKKIILERIIAIINIIFFVYLIFKNDVFSMQMSEIWFFVALILLGAPFLLKSYFYKLDADLYESVLLVSCGAVGIISNFFMLDFYLIYPYYIFAFAFASFMVFLFFRQNIHFKLFALETIEVIILLLYKLDFLSVVIFAIVNTIYLAIILMLVVLTVRKSIRRT